MFVRAVRIVAAWAAVTSGLGGAANVAIAQPTGSDARAIRVLEEASASYESVAGLCARFEQILEVPLLQKVTRSEGELCQLRPNLFRMDFAVPDGDVLVVDGDAVWMYYPSMDADQALRRPLTGTAGGQDFYREFLDDPGGKYDSTYDGEDMVGDDPVHVISLAPVAAAAYRRAQVWIDQSTLTIRKVEIEEDNGSVRTLTLDDIEIDPPMTADHFRFTPPPGVRVVRLPA